LIVRETRAGTEAATDRELGGAWEEEGQEETEEYAAANRGGAREQADREETEKRREDVQW